jgi:hypothetical protein
MEMANPAVASTRYYPVVKKHKVFTRRSKTGPIGTQLKIFRLRKNLNTILSGELPVFGRESPGERGGYRAKISCASYLGGGDDGSGVGGGWHGHPKLNP